MKLTLPQFQGEQPKLDATALPPGTADRAHNVDLDNGVLKPLKGLGNGTAPKLSGDLVTLFRYNHKSGDNDTIHWFEWDKVVDVCPAPIRDNVEDIVCFTGDGYPKVTHRDIAIGSGVMPANSYRLGVPGFEDSLSVEAGSAETVDEAYKFERDYVLTYVCQLGSLLMEGPPSVPSLALTISPAQPVTVSGFGRVLEGNYQLHSKRLYRRRVTNGAGTYQLVAELPPGADSFEDDKNDTEIPGDPLLSESWFAPPETMHSIGALPNGLLYGADGNDVLVSEAYRIHAWNPFARYPCNYPVLGIGQAGNTIVALTAENPFVIAGLNPTAMSATELMIDQGCVTKRSIVSGPFGVAYASPDGIVLVNGQAARLVTGDVFSREQWRELNPSSIVASHLDDRYIFSYTKAGGETGGYIFDPNEPGATLIHFEQAFTAAYKDSLSDGLYVFANGQIQQFERGDDLTYEWRSGIMLTRPRSFAAGRIEASSYNDLTLKLFRDDVLVMTEVITSDRGFRLPAGRGSRWQFELTGTDVVTRVTFADSMTEL